jgi:hypothetical protein
MKNALEIMAVATIILMSLNGPNYAGSSKATITVSATVLPRISQSIIHQESRINITEEDIKRGFIEIPSAIILEVKTNERKGYFLHFEGNNELLREVMVMEERRTVVLSPNGGFVHQLYSGSNVEVKSLSYKLHLKKDIQPGSYPFPLRVKACFI